MPISATPMVAIVVHELPVITLTAALSTHVVARNTSGLMMFTP